MKVSNVTKGAAATGGLALAACAVCCAPLIAAPMLGLLAASGIGLAVAGQIGIAILLVAGVSGYIWYRRWQRKRAASRAWIRSRIILHSRHSQVTLAAATSIIHSDTKRSVGMNDTQAPRGVRCYRAGNTPADCSDAGGGRVMRDFLEARQVWIYFAAVVIAALAGAASSGTAMLESWINPALAGMLFVTFLQVPLAELRRGFLRARFLVALLR
jgi:hypothetical protein